VEIQAFVFKQIKKKRIFFRYHDFNYPINKINLVSEIRCDS